MTARIERILRLRYVLPTIQVILAVLLFWYDRNIWFPRMRGHSMPRLSPGWRVSAAINAPVLLVRQLWFRHTSQYSDDVLYVIAVGIFWLWVAISLSSWKSNRTIAVPETKPLRVAADMFGLAVGVILVAAVFVSDLHGNTLSDGLERFLGSLAYEFRLGGWAWLFETLIHGCWAVLILFIFVADLANFTRTDKVTALS